MKIQFKYVVIGVTASLLLLFIPTAVRTIGSLRSAATKDQSLSDLKKISTSINVYAADFDKCLPNASSMPTFRAMLIPYTEPHLQWNANPYWEEVNFNFNLAGVKLSDINANSYQEPAALLLYRFPSNERELPLVATLDGSSRSVSNQILFKSLQYQYYRKGVTLAPADYLSDQDPLKEKL